MTRGAALQVSMLLAGLLLARAATAAAPAQGAYERCLREGAAGAAPELTLGELRAACEDAAREPTGEADTGTGADGTPDLPGPDRQPVSSRLDLERSVSANPFAILPHRPNYLLPVAYNFDRPNDAPLQETFPDEDVELDRVEAKFQISIKLPVAYQLIGDTGHLYFGYTNRSFWQVYNSAASRPFRETDHEPELWLSLDRSWRVLGWRIPLLDIGIVHQSNGRGGSLSRSWNRIYARFVLEKGRTAIAFKPWWRIPEDDEDDDNPDIEDYMGHFELLGVYKHGRDTYSVMLRNNLDLDDNKGAVQLGWSFPLHRHVRGYVQWFNGYGESLIDYDEKVNSLGVGIQITDWL